ncbi:hypothetical protein CP972_17470 [Streptomyces prasinus]|uniref:Uncharacterized protein n=1 Tax=Streptomyces prasinus TaxID=67345 RepID=A0ABX6AYV9_9ACTN|nr:hypothetical protein CP972_17470 [Streptomyces prasinus]
MGRWAGGPVGRWAGGPVSASRERTVEGTGLPVTLPKRNLPTATTSNLPAGKFNPNHTGRCGRVRRTRVPHLAAGPPCRPAAVSFSRPTAVPS